MLRGSGTFAQDPPWNSNKELIPAAASAGVRTHTGWFFISLHIYPQHSLLTHPRHSFNTSSLLPVCPSIYLFIHVPPAQPPRPPVTHSPNADGTFAVLQNEDMVSALRGLTPSHERVNGGKTGPRKGGFRRHYTAPQLQSVRKQTELNKLLCMLGTWRLHKAKSAGVALRNSSLKVLSHKISQNSDRWGIQDSIQTGHFHDKKQECSRAESLLLVLETIHSGLPPYQGCLWEEVGFRMATGLTERMVFRTQEENTYEGHGVGWSR